MPRQLRVERVRQALRRSPCETSRTSLESDGGMLRQRAVALARSLPTTNRHLRTQAVGLVMGGRSGRVHAVQPLLAIRPADSSSRRPESTWTCRSRTGGRNWPLHVVAQRADESLRTRGGQRLRFVRDRPVAWVCAPSRLVEPLGLGVYLGAEQQRGAGQPEPDEHDDDRGECPPCLVIRTEAGGVKREAGRAEEPDEEGDARPGTTSFQPDCSTSGPR